MGGERDRHAGPERAIVGVGEDQETGRLGVLEVEADPLLFKEPAYEGEIGLIVLDAIRPRFEGVDPGGVADAENELFGRGEERGEEA